MPEIVSFNFLIVNADGETHEVLEHTTRNQHVIDRIVRLALRDGRAVNRRKDGSFEIADSDDIFRKV